MATGRIIKTQISISEQVNDLTIYSALLFTWMIPHTDDFGRMYANPRRVKAVVVPMRDDFTIDKVEQCLAELHNAKLVDIYSVDGDFYLSMPAFETHQSGLHKRTKSKFPSKSDSDEKNTFPGTSGKFLLEQEQEQEQEKEQKQKKKDLMSGKPDDDGDCCSEIHPDDVPADIIQYLNNITGKQFKFTETNLKLVKARIKEGHTQEEMEAVIRMKNDEWSHDPKMSNYLRPSTLFSKEKFNQYVGSVPKFLEQESGNYAWLSDSKVLNGAVYG